MFVVTSWLIVKLLKPAHFLESKSTLSFCSFVDKQTKVTTFDSWSFLQKGILRGKRKGNKRGADISRGKAGSWGREGWVLFTNNLPMTLSAPSLSACQTTPVNTKSVKKNGYEATRKQKEGHSNGSNCLWVSTLPSFPRRYDP